ncbi:condensation domain-containing protein, partial [Glaciimonas sp. GG7]
MPHSVEISAASSVLSNETQVSIHPLSSVQQVVWLDQMLNPDAPHYNIGWTIQIDAAIDPLVLEQAIRDFVMENDAARLTLIKTEGMPQQHILPSVEFVLPVLDFSDETDADQHARDHLNQMHKQPFDLYGGLLWRMALIRASPTRYYWLLCYHHLIADGVSGTQSFTSIASAYNRLLGRDTTTAEAAPSYLDFIAKDQDYSSSARFALDEKFWRQRFTQLPARLVSGDSALSAETLAPSEQFYWSIERPLFKKMTAFAAAHGCSASDFMLALTSVYFARINDLDEVVIGVPIHGRSARDKNTFGMFSSIIPVGVALDRQQPFTHAMAAV